MEKSNFKVKELIGEGGQAKVYKVYYGDKDFALKIFRNEKYFRREIGTSYLYLRLKLLALLVFIYNKIIGIMKLIKAKGLKGFTLMESAVKIRSKYYGIVMSLHEKTIKSINFIK